MEPDTVEKMLWVTVKEVLLLFPNRKKSWAYKELQGVRDCTGRSWVNWRDWNEFGPLPGKDENKRNELG